MSHTGLAPQVFASGLAMGESPRWHGDRLWVSDWGAQEILSFDLEGRREAPFKLPFGLPFCLDFTPTGELLIVDGQAAKIWRGLADGQLELFADLRPQFEGVFNEILVDGRGNAYVNGGPGIVLVTPDGQARLVAGSLDFPNGMALMPDGKTLIVAESHGRRLTAFDISPDGDLSGRRVWADLNTGVPDGICADTEGAIWYADVPNKNCVRVRGEVLDTVSLDQGGFACMLGGSDGRTLFIVANEWRGMDRVAEMAQARTGQVLTYPAPAPGVGPNG